MTFYRAENILPKKFDKFGELQGKQFALDGKRVINGITFEDASPALEALQDYGCLHYKVHIICGVSEPRYSPSELRKLNAQNAKVYDIDGKKMSGYDCTQAMRRLETEVRKQKDIRETARASGEDWKAKFEALKADNDAKEKQAEADRILAEKNENIINRFSAVLCEKKFSHEAIKADYLKKFTEALELKENQGKTKLQSILKGTKKDAQPKPYVFMCFKSWDCFFIVSAAT